MGYYDKAEICLNGHVINDSVETCPEDCESFCSKCGEQTIQHCLGCKKPIQGTYYDGPVGNIGYSPPSYCKDCGKPYPWTETKITTAIQMFAEFGKLEKEEKSTIEEDVNNIARDIPQAELSAMRIKRIWEKYGKIAYHVIMEFACKTAGEILKHP
ncbi:MAG: DUF2321 domain-containing protein [Sedimentisphaerales bacterium]|nr:DUF2321 domain-containing protein [Sedimentisphaerales bacterium]